MEIHSATTVWFQMVNQMIGTLTQSMLKEDAIACVLEHSDTTEDELLKANLDAQTCITTQAPTLTCKN